MGQCWLHDHDTDVPVAYLGPLQEDGLHAPMYGCVPCVDRLRRKLHGYYTHRDAPHQSPDQVVPSSTVRPGRDSTGTGR